jgi:endonuclease-3
MRLGFLIMSAVSVLSPARVAKQGGVKRSLVRISDFAGPNDKTFERQWTAIGNMLSTLKERPPIESMGADALQMTREGPDFRFQTLVGTMLSPQTRDEQTAAGFRGLANLVAPLPLSAAALSKCDEGDIATAIAMVSFYRVKAANLKDAAVRCVTNHDGDIPDEIDELLSFRGVGPKVGYLTFTIARNETVGICVDTHVHRIANRLNWVETASAKSNGPEKTRVQLQSWLKKEYWSDINARMVAFGQSICSAKAPQCSKCSMTDNCSFYKASDW